MLYQLIENKFRLDVRNINKNIATQGNLDPVLLSSDNLSIIEKVFIES